MADAGDPWTQLISVATLGVSRTAPDLAALWPPGVASLPTPSVPDSVLRAAITSYLWRTAGARAPAGPAPQPQRAPAPARALVCEAAAWRLARMLTGTHRELVPEWLALAEEAQRELPVHWLPAVLPGLTQDQRLHAGAVLGPAAAWLATLNHSWRLTPPAPSEEVWASGSPDERLSQLIMLRHEDPDRAREWLTQSWPSETADGRVKLIAALRTRLSAADEAFLEQALDDRRKEVRTESADCLRHLPASAHARRNEERLAGLISVKKGKKGLTFSIELPATLDSSAQRDGLEAKPPRGHQVGERTWWLLQMAARTRPQWWTERWPCDPSALVASLDNSEHGPALIPMLAQAATLQPDLEWARALCRWLASGKEDVAGSDGCVAALLVTLPPAHQHLVIEELLKSAPRDALLDELLTCDIAWSPAATARALSWLGRQITARHWPPPLVHFARRAPVAAAQKGLATLLDELPEETPARGALAQMGEILDFRANMTRELLADG
jgi:hypothetical protein